MIIKCSRRLLQNSFRENGELKFFLIFGKEWPRYRNKYFYGRLKCRRSHVIIANIFQVLEKKKCRISDLLSTRGEFSREWN